jgi:hypothetical protein
MKWLILRPLLVLGLIVALLGVPRAAMACEGAVVPCGDPSDTGFALIAGGRSPSVVVEAGADPAVRDAAANFAEDLGRVGGTAPPVVEQVPSGSGEAILVGVVGTGGLIDALAAAGKVDLSQVAGRWEAFGQFGVADALPGRGRALVIAGSDRRGGV